jgi:hypothetical protein
MIRNRTVKIQSMRKDRTGDERKPAVEVRLIRPETDKVYPSPFIEGGRD